MSRSLTSIKINLRLNAILQNILNDGSSVSVNQPSFSYSPAMGSGVGDYEADRAWQAKSVELGAGKSTIIDLYNMSLNDIGAGVGFDALGQPVVFENIAAIVVVNENETTDSGQLEITPATSKGWAPIGSHTVANGGALKGQGVLVKIQVAEGGFDVSFAAGTGSHRLNLKAVGGPVTYSVYLLARELDLEESSSSASSSTSSISTSSNSSSSKSISTSSKSSASSLSSKSTSSSSSSQSSQSASM